MKFPTPAELRQYYVDPQRFFTTATGPQLPSLQPGLNDDEEPPTVRVSNWYLLDLSGESVLGEITAVLDRDSAFEIRARLQNDYLIELQYLVASMKTIRIGERRATLDPFASPSLPPEALVVIPDPPVRVVKEEEQLLLDAIKTVTEDRQDQYGNPEDSLGTIARYWNAYLASKGHNDIQLSDADAGMLMILLKVAREANKPKRDNLLDIAGYAAITSRVVHATP